MKRGKRGARARGAAGRGGGRGAATNNSKNNKTNKAPEKVEEEEEHHRTSTGIYTLPEGSRDIKIEQFSLSIHSRELITDSTLDFNVGNRYGLVGLNGSGKSTLMRCIGKRDIPLPKDLTLAHVDKEIGALEISALDAVIHDAANRRKHLEAEIDAIMDNGESDEKADYICELYEQLDLMDAKTIEMRAAKILHGLGFDPQMQKKLTKDFSGGWRMRIALAKALFMRPKFLLLDEPTNHLDLEACVWLEEYLVKHYAKAILLIVSHSQDFLNGVCTNIIHLKEKKLYYYGGNYDTFVKTRVELEINQMKRFKWEQDQIDHMKDYIARFGHGSAKKARQAKSKEKVLAKMQASGLTSQVLRDRVVPLSFADVGPLATPVLQFQAVSFRYPGTSVDLYSKLDLAVDLDSRVALVGPNGVGKSTLLNLMAGSLVASEGGVNKNIKLRIGVYRQHLMDQLDGELTPVEYLMKEFPEEKAVEKFRAGIGRFGLTGKEQISKINTLSDGQRCRVVLAWLAWKEPHLLLLDEPTNHLDIETIDALADAINDWDGGLVLVSHDFRLINQVAEEIWVCVDKKVKKYEGTIEDYKKELKAKMLEQRDNYDL